MKKILTWPPILLTIIAQRLPENYYIMLIYSIGL